MSLTILNVAYPFAPVGFDAVGGAEQIVAMLDRGLVAAGHRSLVIACEGSTVEGTLIATPAVRGPIGAELRHDAHACYRKTIADTVAQWPVDLVHMHGLDFCEYLPTADVPVLATIHLPRRWLADDTFTISRPKTYLQPVSRAQRIECGSLDLLPEIENGVAIERFALHRRKRGFALALSRICPEKGLHLALDAAKEANVALLLGGRIFPYREHEDYFDREIAPRLDARRRFLGPLGLARKRRLLGAARCLLVPSLAPETSSLVAMEALASGTPVVAFPSGALPEIVEDGVTGFLVRNTSEMAEAIHRSAELDPEACRLATRRRFSSTVMVERYLALYQRLIDSGAHDRRDPMSAGAGGAWT